VAKVLVIDPMMSKLKSDWLGAGYEVVQPRSYELGDIFPELPGTAGLLTAFRPVPAEMIEAAPDLKVVARPGAGVDNIDIEAATRRGVMVCNVTGVRGRSLAEHALFMMLYLSRHAWMKDDQAAWEATPPEQLAGKTLGVVGLGDIGGNVVKIGQGFWSIREHLIRAGCRAPRSNSSRSMRCVRARILSCWRCRSFLKLRG
jgi:D-3-phosphoglycerate dehydrogenase